METPHFLYSRRQLLSSALTIPAMSGLLDAALTPALAASPASPDLWAQASAQWVINSRLAYFDTAQFAPGIRATLAADYRATEALHSDPTGYYREQFSAERMQALCARIGHWLECGADELSFCRSAVQGLQTVAYYWPLQAGDEVVIHAQLPAALRRLWNELALSRGLVIKTVNLPAPVTSSAQILAAFDNAVTERTRVLMCSHVQELDGAILPIRELSALAHERGAVCWVDGSFSVGALQVSLATLGCDVFACNCGHWLNGASSSAILYVRRAHQAALVAEFRAPATSEHETQGWPALARRWFDLSTSTISLPALPTLLDFQDRLGRARIEARLLALHTYARLRLQTLTDIELATPSQPGLALNILALRSARRTGAQMANWLRANDAVIVSGFANNADAPAGLADVLRISFNLYNSHDDIDRLVLGLQRAVHA